MSKPTRALEDHEVRDLQAMERMARWLDASVRVPGTRIMLGADSILGFIPGVGDLAGLALSLWTLRLSRGMGLRRWTRFRMYRNVGLEALVGTIPLVGDLFDVFFQANRRNVKLVRRELAQREGVRLDEHGRLKLEGDSLEEPRPGLG